MLPTTLYERFLHAALDGDLPTLDTCGANALLMVDGCPQAPAWWRTLAASQRAVAVLARHEGGALASVLLTGPADTDGNLVTLLLHCRLMAAQGRVTTCHVQHRTHVSLPHAVYRFIAGVNAGDAGDALAAFDGDALVNDQLRDYNGHAAIAGWLRDELLADRVHFGIADIVRRNDNIVVTAHLDGTFDKRGLPEPLVVTLYCSLHAQRIAQLIVLQKAAA